MAGDHRQRAVPPSSDVFKYSKFTRLQRQSNYLCSETIKTLDRLLADPDLLQLTIAFSYKLF